jgi:hypothetical protein
MLSLMSWLRDKTVMVVRWLLCRCVVAIGKEVVRRGKDPLQHAGLHVKRLRQSGRHKEVFQW